LKGSFGGLRLRAICSASRLDAYDEHASLVKKERSDRLSTGANRNTPLLEWPFFPLRKDRQSVLNENSGALGQQSLKSEELNLLGGKTRNVLGCRYNSLR
jgi:hypothetical protein